MGKFTILIIVIECTYVKDNQIVYFKYTIWYIYAFMIKICSLMYINYTLINLLIQTNPVYITPST